MGEEEGYARFEVRDDEWEFERKGGYYGKPNKKRKFTKEDAMLGVFNDDPYDHRDEPAPLRAKEFTRFVKSGQEEGKEPEEDDEDDEDQEAMLQREIKRSMESSDEDDGYSSSKKKKKKQQQQTKGKGKSSSRMQVDDDDDEEEEIGFRKGKKFHDEYEDEEEEDDEEVQQAMRDAAREDGSGDDNEDDYDYDDNNDAAKKDDENDGEGGFGLGFRMGLGGLGFAQQKKAPAPKRPPIKSFDNNKQVASDLRAQLKSGNLGEPKRPVSNPAPAPAPAPKKKDAKKSDVKIDTEKYGIGAKLLAKMGYKEGQGLGSDGRGMVEPIQVKLRQGKSGINYGGFKEKTEQVLRGEQKQASDEEMEEMEEKIEAWKAELGGSKKKKNKVVYKTVEELVAENDSTHGGRIQDKIVDMTGPGERVLRSMKDATQKTTTYSVDSHFPELRFNLRHIVDLHANEVQSIDRGIRKEVVLREQLQKEKIETEKAVLIDGKRIERLQKVMEIVRDCKKKAVSSENPFTVESFSSVFTHLKKTYPEEYKLHKLTSLAVAIAHPLLKQVLGEWHPLEDPLENLELFKKWKDLLKDTDGSSRDGTMTPYDNMLYHLWLPKIRTAVSNSWSPREPEPMVRLVDGWQHLIPKWMLENIFVQLVLPKLAAAIEEWNPRKDPVPIHLWVHPWLPFLGEALQPLYVPIRYKMGVVLESWHPSDPSANEILFPWKYVFRRPDLDALLLKSIYPKLVMVMKDFKINPSNQSLEPIQWTMLWGNLLPSSTFVGLWINEFFPKWNEILFTWLTHSPNYDEVTRWYLGWKEVFPKQLLSQQPIALQFQKGLDMMNQLVSGSAHQLREYMAKFRQTEQRSMDDLRAQVDLAKNPKKSHERVSLKDSLQEMAEKHDLVFIPSGQNPSGKPVYKFGTKSISIDKDVITVLYQGSWNQISLEDLVMLASPE